MNTNPKKQKAVFARIHDEIIRGFYPPGALLPNEIELAAKYQVARKTLRGALTMLEEQQLIIRRRPQGTLVCNRLGTPSDGQVISFLLPCADYQNYDIGFAAESSLRNSFSGVVKAAQKHGCRVETLPVTRDNNLQHITWSLLDHLNENSRVVVSGWWYHHFYRFLTERKCRVIICGEREISVPLEEKQLASSWPQIVTPRFRIFYRMLEQLHLAGYRRTAFLWHGHNTLHSQSYLAYRRAQRVLSNCYKVINTENFPRPYYLFCNEVRKLYQAEKFDSALINYDEFTYYEYNFGLPETVKVATEIFCNDSPVSSLYNFRCPRMEMGEKAVELLLRNDTGSEKIFFEPEIEYGQR